MAKLVYHAICVRGMLAVRRAPSADHAFRPRLDAALRKALDEMSGRIRRNGASSVSVPSEALAIALETYGDDSAWREALHININAGLHVIRNRRAPSVDFYLPVCLRALSASK